MYLVFQLYFKVIAKEVNVIKITNDENDINKYKSNNVRACLCACSRECNERGHDSVYTFFVRSSISFNILFFVISIFFG